MQLTKTVGIPAKIMAIISCFFMYIATATTVFAGHYLDEANEARRAQRADEELSNLLVQLNQIKSLSPTMLQEQKLVEIVNTFLNRPYLAEAAQGEGQWPNLLKTGVIDTRHIQQDPIYRTDGFNCTTLVATALALLHATDLTSFKKSIIDVEYGAAQLPSGNNVRYCNRNHFASKDFNVVNQQHQYIKDITSQLSTDFDLAQISAVISPTQWFNHQIRNEEALQKVILTFSPEIEQVMRQRVTQNYLQTYCPLLKTKTMELQYIPKEQLVKKTRSGQFIPNEENIMKIPTPAIMEIVRDEKTWVSEGRPIREKVGTGILVSHMGLLFKQTFQQGDLIYQQTTCNLFWGKVRCKVTPVICQEKTCQRLMFAHATDPYPNNYLYYKTKSGLVCQDKKPPIGEPYTHCNRVIKIPLGDYFAQQQYDQAIYMESSSILGINIQKIL